MFFADHGTKDDLLATLAQLEDQALALRRQAVEQGAEYLVGTAPFPERLHILALVGRFTLDHTALVVDWARWARAEVERWPDVHSGEVSTAVIRAFEEAAGELQLEDQPADR